MRPAAGVALPADLQGAVVGHAAGQAPSALSPLLDSRIAALLQDRPDRLLALVERYGSPLNLVWPHVISGNVERMRGAFAAHDVANEIYYGAKANKSPALVRAAVAAGIGIDVSSPGEFEAAMRAGLDPSLICATGPAKTAAFHRALVEAGALIAVDSAEEFLDLEGAIATGGRARILLRYRPASASASRFGMAAETVAVALGRLAEADAPFAFEGFHAHLSGYAVESRAVAMRELADLADAATGVGLRAATIDIGGGLPVRYVASATYAEALRAQGPGHYRDGKAPTSFYPYGAEQTATDWIDALMRASCRGGTIAGYLRAHDMRIAIEPGRSVVDQAAISVFRVTRVKRSGERDAIVFVEGSSFSACETWFASEFLVDPILVQGNPDRSGGPVRAYIAGHSCLDDDVVTNRLLEFGSLPRPGDLLIYANTAGYQMDLLENEFHRHPMPARLVAGFAAGGELTFVLDR